MRQGINKYTYKRVETCITRVGANEYLHIHAEGSDDRGTPTSSKVPVCDAHKYVHFIMVCNNHCRYVFFITSGNHSHCSAQLIPTPISLNGNQRECTDDIDE